MTATGKSNTDLIAEAVAAIGPWQAWIAAKRVEVQGQIAQMQAAATTPSTGDSSLASRFRQLGLPQRTDGTASAPLPTAPEGSAEVDVDMTAPADTAAAHATMPEEPVNTPATERATSSAASLPALQNAEEAQAYLETVFAATRPHTLPTLVVAAWEGRTADTKYNARMLIGAKEAGVLSEELAHAVSAMITFDTEFASMYQLYEGGFYTELFDIGIAGQGPTGNEEDDAEAEDEAEADEDSRQSPF